MNINILTNHDVKVKGITADSAMAKQWLARLNNDQQISGDYSEPYRLEVWSLDASPDEALIASDQNEVEAQASSFLEQFRSLPENVKSIVLQDLIE